MTGTKLGYMEYLMTSAPNFKPKRNGVIAISAMQNERENTDLRELNLPAKNRYAYFIDSCFKNIKRKSFKKRLQSLAEDFDNDFFVSKTHKERYISCENDSAIFCGNHKKRLAIIYLLSSDSYLWEFIRCDNNFNKSLSNIKIRNLDTSSYAIFKTAKMAQTGKEHIKISELADDELIDNNTFKVIINSFLLLKYGEKIF